MARAHQKLQNNADALSYYRSVLSKDDTNLDALEVSTFVKHNYMCF